MCFENSKCLKKSQSSSHFYHGADLNHLSPTEGNHTRWNIDGEWISVPQQTGSAVWQSLLITLILSLLRFLAVSEGKHDAG